jgi:methyl-accepting chemotaxis protein
MKAWKMKFRKRERPSLSLSAKLGLGFVLVLLIFTGVSGFTAYRLDELSVKDAELRALAGRQETALALRQLVQEMDATAAGYLLSGKSELANKYTESIEGFYGLVDSVGASAETRDQRNWRARLSTVSKEFVANFERAAAQLADPSLDDARKRSMSVAAYNASQIHKQTIFELVQSFYDEYTASESRARQQSTALLESTGAVALWANVAAVVIGAFVAVVVVRSLTIGVRRLRGGIERVKNGDLTSLIAARNKDELGRLSDSFDASVSAVRSMLTGSKGIAESLQAHSARLRDFAGSTKEANVSIVRAMAEMSAGAAKQAEQAERSVATIQELEERMDGVLGAADVLGTSSVTAMTTVREGSSTVQELEKRSERTSGALRTMAEALSRLEARAADIFAMTNAIHDITQQTNILALNASIEAARAGAHGRGFSVIAEEVRLLSVQASDASRRIDETLSQLRAGMQEAAASVSSTADSFADQRRAVNEAGAAFERIVRLIGVFDEEIRRIGDRALEAKQKQAELVDSVHVVASVAQETAAGVEETAAATDLQDESVGRVADEAAELHELAEALFGEINRFRV